MTSFQRCLVAVFGSILLASPAWASFHFMQIEQVIGGVNGDTTAQAIQLRMRSAGQNLVSSARVSVIDAGGANPLVLENMTTNVANSQAGRRVLLATPNFANYTNIPLVADFIMDPIPASYLAAGQLQFTDDVGSIYWSLSWGGSGYTGTTTGLATNDSDGNFGPPVNSALPSTTLQALQFTGVSSAQSTTNLANYAITVGEATFINNAGTIFTVVLPPVPGDYDGSRTVTELDYDTWSNTFGNSVTAATGADGNSNGIVDAADYTVWRDHFVGPSDSVSAIQVPEPSAIALLASAIIGLAAIGKLEA